jgi:hypothetical protein
MPTLYMGLSTADPTLDGSGINEPATANGYARVTTAGTDWNAASGTTTATSTNAQPFTFGPNTTSAWGHVTHWFASDSGTRAAGNMLFWGELPVHKDVSVGDTVTFAATTGVVLTMIDTA